LIWMKMHVTYNGEVWDQTLNWDGVNAARYQQDNPKDTDGSSTNFEVNYNHPANNGWEFN